MGNKLSSTNIAELLEQHLKAITDINDVIVRSNISADVVANINDNIEPISEALKSLDTISEVLSSSKINIIGNVKYNYGIKSVVNNLNELLTSFNDFPIDESKLNDFKKVVKPINEVIEAIISISDKMSNMKIGSIFGNAKFSIAIKGIIENIKNIIEQLKSVDTDEINDKHFKSLSSVISSIVQLTNDLVKIGTIAPLLVALSPSIILAVKIIILINKQFALVGKKGAQGALNAAIIGKALAEFAKGILVFLITSLGGVVFILGVVALLAMKVFMSVFFLLFNRKQMKDILIATIVIMFMAKAIMLISMVVILWALTGQVVMEEWKNILVMMGFVMLAVVVFVLFGLLSQLIKQGNRTMHQLALTLILLSLTVVLWALTGELIVEQQENIFMVVKFVIVALILFTVICILGKIVKTGARELVLIASVLVILSLTVLLWVVTGEYIISKWKEILIVSGFVLITIGLFTLLALSGNILKNGAKSVLLMVLALALISIVILLWAFIGEIAIHEYNAILAVMGFITLASIMMFILAKIYKHVIKGMIVSVLIAAALFILVVVASLAVQVGKMMLENWGGVLMLVGFIVVIVGIFAVIGIPAVFAFVALGSVAMILIGAALLVFSVSVLILVNAIKNLEWEDLGKIAALIGVLGAAVGAIGLIMPAIVLGSVALGILGAALIFFMVPVLLFVATLKILKSIKATDEDIKKPIQMMGTLIAEINTVFGNDALIAIPLAVAKVMSLVPVALAVGIIAETLQNLANLRIATAFNSEGKPIKFRNMKAKDFATAGENASGIVKILASLFTDNGFEGKILGENVIVKGITETDLNKITGKAKRKMRKLSKITGYIGTITNTIGSIATLNIPVGFDEEGQANKFEKITATQLKDASQNISGIIKMLGGLLAGGKNGEAFDVTIGGETISIIPLKDKELDSFSRRTRRKMEKLNDITLSIQSITGIIGEITKINIPDNFDTNKITNFVNGVITGLSSISLSNFSGLFNNNDEIISKLMNSIGSIGSIANLVKELNGIDNTTEITGKITTFISKLAGAYNSLFDSNNENNIRDLDRSETGRLENFTNFVASISNLSQIDTNNITSVTEAIRSLQEVSNLLYGNLEDFIEGLSGNISALRAAVDELNNFIGQYNENSQNIQNGRSGSNNRNNNQNNSSSQPPSNYRGNSINNTNEGLQKIVGAVDEIEGLLWDIKNKM